MAALAAPALGNPAYYYWRQYISPPMHPADAGTTHINNFAPFSVHVDVEPYGYQYYIAPGQQQSVPGVPVADIKFNDQVEVSYVSGDEGTFNYVINPIGGDFPACVQVSPNGCGSSTWCPNKPATAPVTCRAGTELPVTLFAPSSMKRKIPHEFLL
ncbi:hypothetical protein ABOM_008394 [Aspergillus bombycis]|uniref:Uncharacterized protein n=1 Tax=Aspergillus bombycis TaxID=109264 RepID=A0A1F7ZSC7_9EURO|nr:hypothetical protein ABOM_008394 [Aspergillus bombycis]OGM42371.1 hypothetical protein ABOM_008394 [Aspergillus bombycis]